MAKKVSGYWKSRTWESWSHMKQRCLNPLCKKYPDYGGRGITIDPNWMTFEGFYKDMGERPQNKSLDRYPDNNGNYCKENCRWATPKEQSNNRRPRKMKLAA